MIVGIIPARYASTRLKGKALIDIGGKPMLQHTYESAKKSKLLTEIIIATDDKRIFQVAKNFGAKVRMTPKDILTGSDRIAYVAKKLTTAKIIVNIQGDEPFIPGKMIDEAIGPLLFEKKISVTTLAKRITEVKELNSADIPKVVFDYNNYALYFSRSPIPFVREDISNKKKLKKADIYKHIGLYAYRRQTLLEFTSLKPTDLEQFEKLEQLRMLENGIKIKIVVTDRESISIDTKEELEVARRFYKSLKKSRIS